MWDVGTGSGAICVALAVECRRRGYGKDVRFRGTDSSADALALAVENAVGHGVADQIDFALADLTALTVDHKLGDELAAADLIVTNLPYIPSGVVPTLPVAASFEPVAALDGGADGLAIIERLLTELPDALAERGEALLEIGAEQEASVEAAATRALPGWQVQIRNDLAGSAARGNRQPARMSRVIATADADAIELAAAALRSGAIVAIPTETVYGLAALPLAASVERLVAAKQRSTEKGIQLLVDSLEQVRAVALLTEAAEQLAEAFWPGGLTLVLDRRPDVDLPELLGGGRPTLGLRLPDHDVPRRLARLLGPLAASSANISGEPDATTAALVSATLGEEVALIVDDGPVRGGVPSTVVDCSISADEPRVLREGAINARAIAAALGRG